MIVAYILAPIPALVCKGSNDPFDDDSNDGQDVGFFLTGALIISGFALPAVLAHSQVMTYGALGFALGGGIVTYASIVIFVKLQLQKSDSYTDI